MNISENARLWIYQSDRILNNDEVNAIQKILNEFTSEWQAHGHALAALGEVIHSQFIVLSVDEQIAGATGCSIDKSVNLMKEIEQQFGINLFDRFRIAFRQDQSIINCNKEEFTQLIQSGKIKSDTPVFNNLISTRKELLSNWEIPFRQSWHSRVFSLPEE